MSSHHIEDLKDGETCVVARYVNPETYDRGSVRIGTAHRVGGFLVRPSSSRYWCLIGQSGKWREGDTWR